MSNAMHVAKTGLNAQNSRMQVIANNLANVNTTGFKRDRANFETLLLSGFLEGSNVKSVDELVAGIDQARAYEINVKFVTTAKEIDEATASLMRMPS